MLWSCCFILGCKALEHRSNNLGIGPGLIRGLELASVLSMLIKSKSLWRNLHARWRKFQELLEKAFRRHKAIMQSDEGMAVDILESPGRPPPALSNEGLYSG